MASLGDTMELFDREFPYAPIQLQWAGFKGNLLDPYNHPNRKLVHESLKKAKKTISVFSPTLKSSIDIAPITLAQQSKIIETVANITSSAGSPILAILEFNNVMHSILKKNISEY